VPCYFFFIAKVNRTAFLEFVGIFTFPLAGDSFHFDLFVQAFQEYVLPQVTFMPLVVLS